MEAVSKLKLDGGAGLSCAGGSQTRAWVRIPWGALRTVPPPPPEADSAGLELVQGFALPTSPQVTLMLLAQGPHLRNHRTGERIERRGRPGGGNCGARVPGAAVSLGFPTAE